MERVSFKQFIFSLLEAVAYVAAYLLLQTLVNGLLGMALGIYYGIQAAQSGAMPDLQSLETQMLSYSTYISLAVNLLSILAIGLYCMLRRQGPRQLLGLAPARPRSFLSALVLAAGFCWLVTMALELLPISEQAMGEYTHLVEATTQSGPPLLSFLATVLLAPIVEEAVFRGLVYPALRKANGVFFSLLIESLLFGALHGNIIWVVYAACLGAVMTLVYEWSGSLYISLLFHMAFNFLGSYAGFAISDTLWGNLALLACALALTAAGFLLLRPQSKPE